MHRKNLLLVFVVIILIGVFVYPQLSGGSSAPVGISEVSAAPEQYVGRLTLAGSVGGMDVEEGVVYLVDEGGCCSIAMPVPLNQEQLDFLNREYDLGINSYYSGNLPAIGEFVEASGTLNQKTGFYLFEVDTVTRNGQEIINKVN